MNTEKDRYVGCLTGLAVGDAVGTTLEFHFPGSFEPIDDMVGGGPFGLKAGEWTDDTSMALCLASSLIEKQGFDLTNQLDHYCRWAQTGYLSSNGLCFDIGMTVSKALRRYRESGSPYCGSTDPYSAGNGSIMRLAPVPMYYGSDANLAIKYSGESSRATHGATTCVDACRYYGGLMWGALNGVSKDELLSSRYSPLGDQWSKAPLCQEIEAVASGSFKSKQPPEIKGTGYVVESLEAALWAFYHSVDFKSGCLLAVNLGDDADTTGAIYGQLAGAYCGVDSIPAPWLGKLAHREMIQDIAIKLFEAKGMRT